MPRFFSAKLLSVQKFTRCIHASQCFCLVQKRLHVPKTINLNLSVCVSNLSEFFCFFLFSLSMLAYSVDLGIIILSIIQLINNNMESQWTQALQDTILVPLVTPLHIASLASFAFTVLFATSSTLNIIEPMSQSAGYLLQVCNMDPSLKLGLESPLID